MSSCGDSSRACSGCGDVETAAARVEVRDAARGLRPLPLDGFSWGGGDVVGARDDAREVRPFGLEGFSCGGGGGGDVVRARDEARDVRPFGLEGFSSGGGEVDAVGAREPARLLVRAGLVTLSRDTGGLALPFDRVLAILSNC